MLRLPCVTSCSPALGQGGPMFLWAHHPPARGGFDCATRALCWLGTCCDAGKVVPLTWVSLFGCWNQESNVGHVPVTR